MTTGTQQPDAADFVLTTDRLALRPPAPDDVDALWPHVSNKEITTYLAWTPHSDKSQTRTLIGALNKSQAAGTACHWLVLFGSRAAGLVSLIDRRHRHLSWTLDRAELAFWIAPEFQRRGFAREASRAVIEFGFAKLGLAKIRVAHAAENDASRVVCERLGFHQYARERMGFCKDGRWYDLIWYDMVKNEFQSDGE